MIETTRRVQRVLEDGWIILIAGEGRIHRGERELMPLADGPAYFALRARVPIVPIAINGTSWLGFGRRIRVRVGDPLEPAGRASRETVDALDRPDRGGAAADDGRLPDRPQSGRAGRWLTEVFNDWPEGARPDLGGGDAAGTSLADRAAAGGSDRRGRPTRGILTRGRCGILRGNDRTTRRSVGATGLSADTSEYRARLAEQTDAQIDSWAAEMMRDVAIRRGVVRVVDDFCGLPDSTSRGFERVFASGGGPPAAIGHDARVGSSSRRSRSVHSFPGSAAQCRTAVIA